MTSKVDALLQEVGSQTLAHHGVKGMKWGVRKGDDDKLRLTGADQGPTITGQLNKKTELAAKEVSALMSERYDFKIKEVVSIGPGNAEYEGGTIGYVALGGGNKSEGTIFANQDDLSPGLKYAEEVEWFGKDCGNEKAFLTHESAHAIFHAPVEKKQGLLRVKETGGHIEARNKALNAAMEQFKRDGGDPNVFSHSISGYVAASRTREEAEAELFSQYHWGDNPNNFVKVWGETLHSEMGLDPTPFKEMKR